MINKYLKITVVLISFIFLTGFIPFISLLGPGYTIAKSGSFYKAGAQIFLSKSIKDSTGKHSLDILKEKIKKEDVNNNLNLELEKLVKRRIELARKTLNLSNVSQ